MHFLQVKLSACQRIVLLNYNKETKLIDFRHYSIRLQPVGVSRRLRKFVQKHQVPNLSNLQDVSDFITRYAFSFSSFCLGVNEFLLVSLGLLLMTAISNLMGY